MTFEIQEPYLKGRYYSNKYSNLTMLDLLQHSHYSGDIIIERCKYYKDCRF